MNKKTDTNNLENISKRYGEMIEILLIETFQGGIQA